MLRIVDGMVFEGHASPDRFAVTMVDMRNGHKEVIVQRAIDWVESGPLDPDSICAQVMRGEREDPNAAEKKAANLKRAARRAKTNARRRCKAQGCDTLLTLTYKGNQTDLELAKRHFQAFADRIRWAMSTDGRKTRGEFVYVAAFERQKRGAWHVHIATHALPRELKARNGVKVKSFNVVRAMWRDVAGDWGGNIDQARRKHNSKRSPARIASYLSKYILKAFEQGEDWSKRYLASRCEMPERVRMEFERTTMLEVLELAGVEVLRGHVVLCSSWVSRFGDTVYLAVEPSS